MNSSKKYTNKFSSFFQVLFIVLCVAVPYVAQAAPWSGFGVCKVPPEDFKGFICISMDVLRLVIIYVAASAVLAFLWGLSKFILASGSEEKIADGKWIMKWGVIGLFFMFSVWGVVQVLVTGFFGASYFGIPLLPQ